MNNNGIFFNNFIEFKNLKISSKSKSAKKFDRVFSNIKTDLKNSKKTLNILDNKFKFNFKITDLNKFKKFKTIAIVGMGGSVLGAEAMYNFFGSKIKKKIYFFDDLNENKLLEFRKNEKLSNVLFIVISKSGNTIETLSNSFSLKILKNNSKNVIIISEKRNNSLYSLAQKYNLFHVEHNNYIGGRYSVLSEVGVIPAFLMGINIKKLRSKILDCFKEKNKKFLKNCTIKLVQLINSKKCNNLIFLNYAPKLEKFLYWYQQLIAESLGKKGKGFFPVISNVPKDHHSLLQLYLDGPKDKLFHIFCDEKMVNKNLSTKKNKDFKKFSYKKNLNIIKNAQKNALIKSLTQKKILFRETKLNISGEETLGNLFSYFIVETVIIGKMLNVDPFDQPAVEQVKKYTNQLLK